MTDGQRATREADYVETDLELVTFEHYIPIEELEVEEVTLQIPIEGEVDPDEPF